MVECMRCGCRNDNESRFCAACGFSLLAPRITRATPPSGFAASPAPWPAPSGPIAQQAAQAPYAQAPSAPMAAIPEAEWNLVQRRGYMPDAPAVAPMAAMQQPIQQPAPMAAMQQPMQQPTPMAAMQQPMQPPMAAMPPMQGENAAPSAYNAQGLHNPAAQPRSTTPPVGQTEPPRNLMAVLMGFLVSYDGNEVGRFWPLYQGRIVVGRAQATEGLDIAIDHGATSARHAQLIAASTPSRLSVQDLGSTNGTFINDQRLAPGHAQMVAHGDQIRFGGFTVRVVLVL